MLRYPHTGSYRCPTVTSTSTAPSPAKVPPTTATASTTSPLRVAGITIRNNKFNTMVAAEDHVAVLWRTLDHCVVPAEERAIHVVCFDSDTDIPAALMMIDIEFPYWQRANTSIIGQLTMRYPTLVRSLQVLKIVRNNYDESAELGAFAALAKSLQELTLWYCGLTSLEGLEGRCDYLRKMDPWNCKQLNSLDGLAHHVYLEEVDATETAITSIEPLRTCPALKKVIVSWCQQLSSVQALANHQWLEVINVAGTAITSVEPLRTCPALTKVDLRGCHQLPIDQVDWSAGVTIIRK